MAKKEIQQTIDIKPLNTKTLIIPIQGDTEYISHCWAEKAIREIQDKQAGKAKSRKKEPRVPDKEYAESIYWLGKDGNRVKAKAEPSKHKYGFGIPSVSFKAAAVAACRNIDNIPMTISRGALHVQNEFVPIMNGDGFAEPYMRTDMVRIGMGVSDVRYRGAFKTPWRCELKVIYNEGVLTAEQVVNLFNVAGFACGVGEWRPSSKNGMSYGMFHVA